MHLNFRNVNDAFYGIVKMFHTREHCNGSDWRQAGDKVNVVRKPSRNGDVLMIEQPVLITYEKPTERVLFNTARDANPFFHLYEALWMLAGRREVEPVAYYCNRMRKFSDDGQVFNGAYGYRWRAARFPQVVESPDGAEYIDQLEVLVAHLKANPTSRRAVLSMWNVEDDLLKIDNSKDVCCNLDVMFCIRGPEQVLDSHQTLSGQPVFKGPYLDMTVTNRSNDAIWGLLGANYVHFTILQEYIAARLGVEVGRYHHFTNNLHVYSWNWKPDEWLEEEPGGETDPNYSCATSGMKPYPLVKNPLSFDSEVKLFVQEFGAEPSWQRVEVSKFGPDLARKLDKYSEPFLREVAGPALLAFRADKFARFGFGGIDLYGAGTYSKVCLANIKADDWRITCSEWLRRRQK